MFRISSIAFVVLFLAMFFVHGDCRPQLPLPGGLPLGAATGTLTGAAMGVPVVGGVAQSVLTPVGHIPQSLPVVGGVLNG